jgi:NADPH:quinone reductase-like Zn-dependent oxidoreductase
VLIVGAGGSIGTWTVQLAKLEGAEVTGVDHASKLDMLREIGADHVIDYTREDYTQNGRTYDVIIDTYAKSPFIGSLKSLNENGTYVNANPSAMDKIQWRSTPVRSGVKVLTWTGDYSTEILNALKALIEAGRIRAVIDRVYPLEQIADAHRYVDAGLKKGNVILSIEQNLYAIQ